MSIVLRGGLCSAKKTPAEGAGVLNQKGLFLVRFILVRP